MQALIHTLDGKTTIWVAANVCQLDVAFAMLFRRLDEMDCYLDLPGQFYNDLNAARDGKIGPIKALLTARNGRPKETWRVQDAINAGEYEIEGQYPLPAGLGSDTMQRLAKEVAIPGGPDLNDITNGIHNGTIPSRRP